MSELDRYRIADTEIGIISPYEAHRKYCSQYSSRSDCTPELIIEITEKEIQNEFQYYTQDTTAEYASLSLIFRKLCEYIITKGGFVLHSAVVEYSGLAYAFVAPSGTGKSTHIKNWRKLLADKVDIVNGDKPIIIFKDGKYFACGTPWAGKEGWHRNVCVPLGGVCRVYRDDKNSICKADAFEFAEMIMGATLIPQDPSLLMTLLDTIDSFTQKIPAYKLYCTADISSATVSFEKMTGHKLTEIL